MIPQSHLYLSSKILSISTSSFFNQCHFRFINAMYRHFSLSQLIPFSNPAIMSFFHLHCFQIAVFALKWIFPMEQIPINGVRTWKINQQAQKNGILCNPFLQLGTGCFYSLLPEQSRGKKGQINLNKACSGAAPLLFYNQTFLLLTGACV